jgi:hypothetical protein
MINFLKLRFVVGIDFSIIVKVSDNKWQYIDVNDR